MSGGAKTRYGYEAKEYSSLVGDTDFHFRKYKPEWGLFTKPDTLISNVYDPQSLNRYAFEQNNPVNKEDKDGHNVYAYIGIGAFLLGATWYWVTHPVDYSNPQWGNRLLMGSLHGTNWAVHALLALTLKTNAVGRVVISEVTLESIAKNALAALSQSLWEHNLEGTKTSGTELAITAGSSVATDVLPLPSFAQTHQYVATSSFLSKQNYNMFNDYLMQSFISSAFENSANKASSSSVSRRRGGESIPHYYSYSDPSQYPNDPQGVCIAPSKPKQDVFPWK